MGVQITLIRISSIISTQVVDATSTTPLFQTIQNNTLQNQPHHLL